MTSAFTDAIEELWTTPVWIGRTPPWPEPVPGASSPTAPPPIPTDLQPILNQLKVDAPLTWTTRIQTWEPGYHAGMRWNPGLLSAVHILRSDHTTQHASRRPESGRITLHDPRPAATGMFVPGLPWGRPAHIPALTGATIVFPSWLGWSVEPLCTGHTIHALITTADQTGV